MKLIKKLLNLYIYSSLHIGLGAVAMSYLIYKEFQFSIDYDYLIFLFSSTVFLYCIHRIIGIQKMVSYENKGRFLIINEYKSHILFYGIASLIGCCVYVLKFDYNRWFLIIIPSIISILYALPVFPKGKRLRDFGYIKIFLVAIIWAWTTVFIPLFENQDNWTLTSLLTLEKMLFIFSITIPFDLRDAQIDRDSNVKTLIHSIGVKNSYRLSYLLLVLSAVLMLMGYFVHLISMQYLAATILSYIGTGIIIKACMYKSADYYYTGLLDGTMFLALFFYTCMSLLSL